MTAMALASASTKGDRPGHPFRGNQWTGGAGGGRYDKTTGKIDPPPVLRYKANDPIAVLKSGEIRPSDTYQGVSLTSAEGLQSHGPFEIEFDTPPGIDLSPAVYGEPIKQEGKLRPTGMRDQFGNEYTMEEWDSLPPNSEGGVGPFRMNSMFKDEAEWRSNETIKLPSKVVIRVYKNTAGWRLDSKKHEQTLVELKEMGYDVVEKSPSRLAVAKHLLSVATQAVQLKRMLLKDQLRRAVVKAVHVRQWEEAEREIQEAASDLIKRQFASASKTAKEDGSTGFDPREWDQELVDSLLPVLMKKAGEAAAAQMLLMGVDVVPKRRRGTKRRDGVHRGPISTPNYHRIWQQIREGKRRCQRCGAGADTVLIVHHVDGDGSNDDRGNLQVLCDACHRAMPDGPHTHPAGEERGIENLQTKASRATEWLLALEDDGEDLSPLWPEVFALPGGGTVDLGFATEWPDWMKAEITKQMQDCFAQPFWAGINDTTASGIQSHVLKGLEEGLSIREIQQMMVGDGLDEYYRNRGQNIARTEAGNALNGARSAAMDRLSEEVPGLKTKKTWMSVLGTTTRDSHAALDGVPADRNGEWYLGGVKIPWPAHWRLPPSERCSCQCTLVQSWGMPDSEAEQLIEDYNRRLAEERAARDFWTKHLAGRHDQSSHGRGGSVLQNHVSEMISHLETIFKGPGRAAAVNEVLSAAKFPEYLRGILQEVPGADEIRAVVEWSVRRGRMWEAA